MAVDMNSGVSLLPLPLPPRVRTKDGDRNQTNRNSDPVVSDRGRREEYTHGNGGSYDRRGIGKVDNLPSSVIWVPVPYLLPR